MPRLAAWEVLRSGSPTPLRDVERAARRHGLDARDARLLRRVLGTEVRRRGTLRALVRRFARGKPKPDLAAHLHLGLAQLLFLDRVPEHAVFSETSDAVARTLGAPKVRFAVDVLRRVRAARREGTSGDPRRDLPGRELHLAEPVFHDPAEHPYLWFEDALSLPAPLAKRWTKRLGRERAERLARAALAEPPLVLRVAAGTREEAVAELAALDVEARSGVHPRTLRCAAESTGAVLASEPFRAGRLTVQGEAALAAAELVGAREGERVLDLCAAPGGKSAVLAQAGATVLAVDRGAARLVRLADTCRRLGVAARVFALAADATSALAPGARFDAVLVDAPCSNTAVLAARPAARWRFGPKTLAELVRLQQRLLDAAAGRVRSGGRLVWSTCSLEPEENEQLVRGFLARAPGFALDVVEERVPDPDGGTLDGGWAARLLRVR